MNKVRFIPLMIAFITLSSCEFFTYTSEAVQIQVKSKSFVIAWSQSNYTSHGSPSSIKSFNIYYRVHGHSGWYLIDEIENTGKCEFIINNDILGYGVLDFAVSAVNVNGMRSELHSSLDTTADPVTGWYINWIGSK